MGASTKIQDTNLNITKFACSQCQQKFTDKDKENDNWDLWWDTSNDVKIDEIWPNNNGFTISIWVRDMTHQFSQGEINGKPWSGYDCPDLREKERIKLIQHVNNNYFIQQKEKPEYWEVSCWLGKEPTGRLFTVKQLKENNLNDSLAQLAKDMYEFLYTPKGEEILRKEHGEVDHE